MRSNIDFIKFAKSVVGHPYIFGTFGQKLTKAIVDQKGKDYPSQMTAKRCAYAKEHYLGQTTFDCNGLFKAFIWGMPEKAPKYDAKTDWNAKMIYENAKEKGTLETMPKNIPGIALFNKSFSHVATWDGKQIVEAKGFDYGVVEGKSQLSSFYYWAKHPLIDYSGSAQEPSHSNEGNSSLTVEEMARRAYRGDFGNYPERKTKIEALGFSYAEVQGKLEEMYYSWDGLVNTVRDPLNVRKSSDPASKILRTVPKGSIQKFKGEAKTGMYQLADGSGWCAASLIKKL